jgi:hypothetical protein
MRRGQFIMAFLTKERPNLVGELPVFFVGLDHLEKGKNLGRRLVSERQVGSDKKWRKMPNPDNFKQKVIKNCGMSCSSVYGHEGGNRTHLVSRKVVNARVEGVEEAVHDRPVSDIVGSRHVAVELLEQAVAEDETVQKKHTNKLRCKLVLDVIFNGPDCLLTKLFAEEAAKHRGKSQSNEILANPRSFWVDPK